MDSFTLVNVTTYHTDNTWLACGTVHRTAVPEYFGLYTNPRPETPSVGNSLSYGPVDLHRSEIPRPDLDIAILTLVL